MKRFLEVVDDPDSAWDEDGDGPVLYLDRGDGGYYEVRLEPLLFGQYYLAVYVSDPGRPVKLIGGKVPVRPGGGEE